MTCIRTGSCDTDGMYYMDQSSYVMCSHGIAYVMPCAPGTMNSGLQLQNLNAGDYLGFSAFCDVNLVDVGYAALVGQKASGYGAGPAGGAIVPQSSGYGASAGTFAGTSAAGYGGTSAGTLASTLTAGYGASPVRAKPTGTLVISYQPQTAPASGYGQPVGGSTLARIIRPAAAMSAGFQD